MGERVRPGELRKPSADDRFEHRSAETDFAVGDFWAWALADLRMNTARGFLAEYLVAQAVGSRAEHRVEWAPYDVLGADETRIEVKATGYSQSWTGSDGRSPSWSFRALRSTRAWDDEQGKYLDVEPRDRVHVWVFALHQAKRDDVYDPLNLDLWAFFVVPNAWLCDAGQVSAGLSFFERHGIDPVAWDELAAEIRRARSRHDALRAGLGRS